VKIKSGVLASKYGVLITRNCEGGSKVEVAEEVGRSSEGISKAEVAITFGEGRSSEKT
jgi:hypothetical protein